MTTFARAVLLIEKIVLFYKGGGPGDKPADAGRRRTLQLLSYADNADRRGVLAAPVPSRNNVSRPGLNHANIPQGKRGASQTTGSARVPARLDAIDRHILRELQEDGRITNVELARRIGISAPPCLRRVRALEQAGYITGYRALLNPKLLGYEVTVFALVHLSSQADADLKQFEEFVRHKPMVRECWMLSGEVDFILKCVAPDLNTFQNFVAELTAAPQVRNVKTSLTLRNCKDAALVPMEAKEK
jgi:DNA-binding Lrp family transcriptional regulator